MSIEVATERLSDGAFGNAKTHLTTTNKSKPKTFQELYAPLSEVLGSGAYARVESFRRIGDGEEVAVKIVESFGNERARQKVFKEIEIYSLCSGHPHIIDLREYFEDEGRFFLVFPRMSNSLFETIVQRSRLFEFEAANVVRQIASGIAYLHSRGIAHRDIKPENILCERPGQLDPVVICDFDLGSPVRLVRENSTTTPQLLTPVGSAEFMAPEVVDAWLTDQASSYDKRCDLWSLGVITYVLLCGYAPFNGNCGKPCGWQSSGRFCSECQMDLFFKIQSCEVEFPEQQWKCVTEKAKDFVRGLLVRDAKVRPSAVELLNSSWILHSTSQSGDGDDDENMRAAAAPLLATPSTLKTSSALSFLLERSNDAYRRASMVDQLGDSLQQTPFSAIPIASFRVGDDSGSENEADTDDDDEGEHDGGFPDEQLMATTPRAGFNNFEKLEKYVADWKQNSAWSPEPADDHQVTDSSVKAVPGDSMSEVARTEKNLPSSLMEGGFDFDDDDHE